MRLVFHLQKKFVLLLHYHHNNIVCCTERGKPPLTDKQCVHELDCWSWRTPCHWFPENYRQQVREVTNMDGRLELIVTWCCWERLGWWRWWWLDPENLQFIIVVSSESKSDLFYKKPWSILSNYLFFSISKNLHISTSDLSKVRKNPVWESLLAAQVVRH